jgi:hypothetical protein
MLHSEKCDIKHPATTLGIRQYNVLKRASASSDGSHRKGFQMLNEYCKLDYVSKALEIVDIGPYGSGKGHDEFIDDAMQIYHLSLMYIASNDERYAQKSISLIDTWIKTCKEFKGLNAPLEVGWGGTCIVKAVEILKYSFKGWNIDFEIRFKTFIDKIFIPNLRTRYNEIKKWNNNWILTIQECLLQIALFKDDMIEVGYIIEEFKHCLCKCIPYESGQCTETKRDLIHAQFQFGSMLQIAETCWHQGINLYSLNNNIIMKCLEYHASILNGKVPNDVIKNELKDVWFMPSTWDVGYNHYVNRMKLVMPETDILLKTKRKNKRNRPEKASFNWGPGWIHFDSK